MKRSKELGHRAELVTAAGQPHGFFNRPPWREKTLQRADEFLASLGYLQGQPTIQVPAGAHNRSYLQTKREKLGHLLDELDAADED